MKSTSATSQLTATARRPRRAEDPDGLRVALAGFPEFEASLDLALTALAAGDRREEARRALVTAKSRARLGAARCRDAGRRSELLEMAEWILIALENPAAFPCWSALRKRSPGFAALAAERSRPSVRHTTDASREP